MWKILMTSSLIVIFLNSFLLKDYDLVRAQQRWGALLLYLCTNAILEKLKSNREVLGVV